MEEIKQDEELGREFTFLSLGKFVAPSIFTFVFISVYQMVDGFFIQKFVGDIAISAISLYYPIISLFIAVGIMIGTGGNAVIVRKVGEGKKKEAGETFSRVITFTVIIGILCTAICLIFQDPIMRLCGATSGNIEYLRPYYRTLSAFCLAILLQSELGILIIGEGKTVVAAIISMIGGVTNCVLDYLFMNNLGMGIAGAAFATVIGYCVTILYALWFYTIAKKSSYHLEIARPDIKEIGGICFNGSSDMISNLAQGVTVLFMNHLAYRCYGEEGVSSLTVVTYIQVLIMMVFMGYTSAVEPVFSYHYGSGNVRMRKVVYRLSIIWNLVLGLSFALLIFILRDFFVSIFFDKGSNLYDISMAGVLLSLPAAVFCGISIFGSGLFTAFSNGLVSGILSFMRTFVFLTVSLYGLTFLFGGYGLWSAWPFSELLSLVMTLAVLKKYRDRYKY